jgi:ADP-heptose:LPS heptosyltransferase
VRTQRKILLDRWVARPLAQAAAAAFPRHGGPPGDMADVREIVVAKLLGLGSLLHATPLLRSLRASFPHARLTLLTTAANRELAVRLEPVDDVLCLDDAGLGVLARTTTRVLRELRRRRVDLYVDLEAHSAFAKLLARASGARRRLGFEAPAGRGLATDTVPFDRGRALRALYLDLAHQAGIPPAADDSIGPVRVEAVDRARLRQRLGGWWRDGAPYVVVNPNASALCLERRWPEGRFVSLVDALAAAGHRVVLVGAAAESDYVGGLEARVHAGREHVLNAAGHLGLGELLALLEEAACVVSNDSGPMHMAVALGRPTVGLFGPCAPAQFRIESEQVAVLYRPVPCSPCVHSGAPPPCGGDNVCMKLIEVDEVLALVQARL